MTEWQKFWNSFPLSAGRSEHLKQVGKTVQGQPISGLQFRQIHSDIAQHLALSSDDVVLDLCCGNGLITKEIAQISQSVVGVDFSHPLINIAGQDHQPDNVRYHHLSVLDLTPEAIGPTEPFTKVYMYEALQDFGKGDLVTILATILELSADDVVILLGSVLDKSRFWHFYNTPQRRFDFFKRKLLGGDTLGTWWDKRFIQETCNRMGWQSDFLPQHTMLHTAHYRFDVRIRRALKS